MLSFNSWRESITQKELQDIKSVNLPDANNEIGVLDGKKIQGSKDHVEFDLTPPEKGPHKLIVHTHPGEEPSLQLALPSGKDLKGAVEAYDLGYPGIAIFSGPHFVIVKPTRNKIIVAGYENSLKQAQKAGDITIVLKKLRSMGFEVETGEK